MFRLTHAQSELSVRIFWSDLASQLHTNVIKGTNRLQRSDLGWGGQGQFKTKNCTDWAQLPL
jgi:hypothetical protein